MATRHIPSLLLIVAVLSNSLLAAPSKKPDVPWHDPATGIVWRGDQRHPSRNRNPPGESLEIYRIDSLRWDFEETPTSWLARFGEAWVDTRKATGLSLLMAPFPPRALAGHAALLIHLEPGGLKRIVDGRLTPTQETGIVVSLEAFLRVGQTYGFIGGMTGAFRLVYSLSTWENYLFRYQHVRTGELRRWQIEIPPEEVPAYADAALRRTLRDHRQETYWLTRNSCATAVIDMLIAGAEESRRRRGSTRSQESALDLQESNDALARFEGSVSEDSSEVEIQREFLNGLLVNPMMSLPAQLAQVLERRGLVKDHEHPDAVYHPLRMPDEEPPEEQGRQGEPTSYDIFMGGMP